MHRLQSFFRRHPLIRDAFIWALPALAIGAVLRALMMSYLPYAVWGADSRSYYSFAHKLFYNGWFSLGDKRRFLYPLLMVPVSILPGGALRWLPGIQHTLGLITLLPLAYIVRKTLVYWRIWIAPVTIVYAGFPIVLYSEHELLGEHLFFVTLIWSFAGWVAWIGQARIERSRSLYWWFFVPFALFILTKPAGRFVWPGIFVGLVMVAAWRLLTRRQVIALICLMAITPFVGSKKQGAWLLYTATFPLTRLDTPLHADYKAEIAAFANRMRANLDLYYQLQDEEPFYFLRDPGEQEACPLWKALGKNKELKDKIYMDLALEGIKARPDLFLYLAIERIVATSNVSGFSPEHFDDNYYSDSFAIYYKEAQEDEGSPVRLALALPKKGMVPPYEEYRQKLEPSPGSWQARVLQTWVKAYDVRFDFFRFPKLPKTEWRISLSRPTFLFWWLCAGMLLSFLPAYRRTLGVWMMIAVGYAFGVFLVSLVVARYFAPIWPVLLILLAIPLDAVFGILLPRLRTLRQT